MEWPLVSCIMPTYNRRHFVPQAIRYFLRQDYPQKELVILDDGTDKIGDLIPAVSEIRYVALPAKLTVGEKRNLAVETSRGDIIVHWDDDDWMHPRRISYQVEPLLQAQADISGINKVLFYDLRTGKTWLYEYPEQQAWLYGGSLCYRKAFWAQKKFDRLNVGEDTKFVWTQPLGTMLALPDATFYVAMIHAHNTSGKSLTGPWWHRWKGESVQSLMQDDWDFYVPLHAESASVSPRPPPPVALVSAAAGIGDILRITPLIRVFASLGYQVDVLLAPDYPDVVTLLEGAPEIRRLYTVPGPKASQPPQAPPPELRHEVYDVATFTVWSAPWQRFVRARQTFAFAPSQWLQEGDSACVAYIARAVGWNDPLPAPFALPSTRRFGLAPNTVALHPGCKPDWPWKKWHGFAELARLLPNVALIGTPADVDNAPTYFRMAFDWPKHVSNFIGTLSLQDTAALLRECAALVSNDSGLMHLGVALGIPTFGIFGITSPQREVIPAEHMFPITKGLPCEPACRQEPWGRRDCAQHLACLKSLTAQEVFAKIQQVIPAHTPAVVSRITEPKTMDTLNVMYYGYVFDASGYGQAARAYIHALHSVGINLSVVDLTNRTRQVQDALVASLVGKPLTPDVHLFHGIPPEWARLAFRLPNAIGMTVWETDTMPTQWRNILNHALEVWLPCEFNVAVFHAALDRPIFKLPHTLFPAPNAAPGLDAHQFLPIAEDDWVFYSIFEWQDRKGPRELLETYLRAFPTATDTLLVLKTNPGAAQVAHQAVATLRQQVCSEARVEVRCEVWDEAHLAALQARGDCYVSLHRGEGWGYPLFEAASRGTPVIATNYAGPLEYLHPHSHHLVRWSSSAVRQPYIYYSPRMHWADPDLNHAAELMRRVYENRDSARERAAKAAELIQENYSLEKIGTLARSRLLNLLQRTNPRRSARLIQIERRQRLNPPIPIPGDWYDQDYFENGLKSNWAHGYSWTLFASLFQETAQFLTEFFSEADSFLDIGCAKGFLVRALHERRKEGCGFDHSRWAIDQADAVAKPFLRLASVDEVHFDRQFDVLLALSMLESLTEGQLQAFLTRARAWTRQAFFATITTLPPAVERQAASRPDCDLSHVTMQPRAWWQAAFLRAGWRQDYAHRLAQQFCQNHPLILKMGWQVYLFAP